MLHRPYIRKDVRQAVEDNAQKNENGQFLDANTNQPIEGQYDLGHKPGHEFWREQQRAEEEGLTQEEFNDRMNNPDLYQIEDPSNNRSHRFEDHSEEESMAGLDVNATGNEVGGEGESESMNDLSPAENAAEPIEDNTQAESNELSR